MGIFSRFEDKMEDTVEGAASRMSKAPISPVQIAKKAERQMRRETMVGAGKEFAPTLYTVLVNPDDDARLFGYYPTLAGETETYLKAKAAQEGLVMDGNPLVRFIVDDGLRHGKFDIIAETVAAPIIAQLRQEEMERYGLAQQQVRGQERNGQPRPQGQGHAAANDARAEQRREPLPYVPEEEIDRSINYGEYTFDSHEFQDYGAPDGYGAPGDYDDYGSYEDPYAQGASQDPYANQEDPYPAPVNDPRGATPMVGNYAPMPAADPYAGNGPSSKPLDRHDAYDQRRPNRASEGSRASAAAAAAQRQSGQRTNFRAAQARLIELDTNRAYGLTSAIITLGRDASCDISIKDINASRKHAELRLSKQGPWVITDLDSTNGTLVNGVAIASQPLYPGDVITIGKTDLEFTLA